MTSYQKSNYANIIGIQYGVFSPDEIERMAVVEVTKKDTFTQNKPVPGGLFDLKMGPSDSDMICSTDGLNNNQCPGYFGFINLNKPVFLIQHMATIHKICKCTCLHCSKLLISKHRYGKTITKDPTKRLDEIVSLCSNIDNCGDEIDNGCGKRVLKVKKDSYDTLIITNGDYTDKKLDNGFRENQLTPEKLLAIFRKISDEDVSFMGFSPIFSRPDWFIATKFPIGPPSVRPGVKRDVTQRSEDDITHMYVNLIKVNDILGKKIAENSDTVAKYAQILQYNAAVIINNKLPGVGILTQRSGRPYKSMSERLVGKPGIVRYNLMGKRVDFSARTVITADPSLSIRQLGVPKKIAENITKPEVVNERNRDFLTKLVRNGPDVYPGAISIKHVSGRTTALRYANRDVIVLQLGEIVNRHLMDGDFVLFNRQPTLHRMSMMGHVARIMPKADTFRMNLADTKPYNADEENNKKSIDVCNKGA